MQLYIFQSGDEFLKLKIDWTNKKFERASRMTNNRFIPTPFWKLFGNPIKTLTGFKPSSDEEAKKEMEELKDSSNEELEIKLMHDFTKIGYKVIKS